MQVSLYLRVTSRSQQNSWELSGQPKLTEILQRECRFGNFLQDIFKIWKYFHLGKGPPILQWKIIFPKFWSNAFPSIAHALRDEKRP